MSNSKLFVLDTNVIVSAVLSPRSVPRQAFDLTFSLGIVLVSDPILVELDDVLRRPKFNRYISEDERLQFLSKFVNDAVIVEVTEVACRLRQQSRSVAYGESILNSFEIKVAVVLVHRLF